MANRAEKCCECMYWLEDKKQVRDNKRRGECKRSEPSLGPNGYGYWPITTYNEFCFAGEKLVTLNEQPHILEG